MQLVKANKQVKNLTLRLLMNFGSDIEMVCSNVNWDELSVSTLEIIDTHILIRLENVARIRRLRPLKVSSHQPKLFDGTPTPSLPIEELQSHSNKKMFKSYGTVDLRLLKTLTSISL